MMKFTLKTMYSVGHPWSLLTCLIPGLKLPVRTSTAKPSSNRELPWAQLHHRLRQHHRPVCICRSWIHSDTRCSRFCHRCRRSRYSDRLDMSMRSAVEIYRTAGGLPECSRNTVRLPQKKLNSFPQRISHETDRICPKNECPASHLFP